MSSAPLADHAANLPTPRTSLVGREREIAAACALLVDEAAPLLTLTGPGGVGKTRLALAVAAAVATANSPSASSGQAPSASSGQAFADGVTFVDLAPIRDPALVLPAIALASGVREGGTRLLHDELVAVLRPRQLLLILDNVEHLLDAAPQVGDLLLACPALQVLATSRAPLRLRGEHDFPVPLLDVADPMRLPPLPELVQTEAVALFIQRARAANPAFALTEANAAAVAEICARLDGLPLALELAAVRLRLLSPQALLALLTNRLTMLTRGARDAPARHQTLRDTIAWSYNLLSADEQILFRRLAVFAGGLTLDAAEAVTAPAIPPSRHPASVLDGITSLVDQSLLWRIETDDSASRFAMLETIREFGLERLAESGEEEATRTRHAIHFLALAERAESHAIGSEQARWLTRLECEHANLRAALAWFADHGLEEQALRLAGTLARFWEVRGHLGEGRRWLDRLLAATSNGRGDVAVRAKALDGAGRLAMLQGELQPAGAYQAESLALFRSVGDQHGIATALTNAAYLAHEQGDTARAEPLYEEALALHRTLGDDRGVAFALDTLGVITIQLNDPARATALLEEGLTHARAAGDRWQSAVTLTNLGFAATQQRDYGRARTYLEEGLDLARATESPRLAAYALSCLGLIALEEGDIEQAVALFADGLAHCRNLGGRLPTPRCLEGIATAAGNLGRFERAARLHGAAGAMRSAIGIGMFPADRAIHDRSVAAVREKLGAPAFAAAWEAGRALTTDRAIAEALAFAAAPVDSTLLISPPAAAPDSPYALSPRELEVLALLARRLTDKEIAAALFISPHTVARHTSNIFTKVGVSSRREAAAVAARLGLF